MRAMALVLGLMAMGCSKTYYVGADGGTIAVCGEGFTVCEPAAAIDGGAEEYPLVCSDLSKDPQNCGACGNDSCGNRGCVGGKCGACLPPTGNTDGECHSDADCCSGTCKGGLCRCAANADCSGVVCYGKPCPTCSTTSRVCE